MAFRTLEISKPTEIHIKNNQLLLYQKSLELSKKNKKDSKNKKKPDYEGLDDYEKICEIPIEDLATIVCLGSNIRISTQALNSLTENKVLLVSLDKKYNPISIVSPCIGYYEQSLITKYQINMTAEKRLELWKLIIKKKMSNQIKALSILGINGGENLYKYIERIENINYTDNKNSENEIDIIESSSAKDYFELYHPALNRRTDDPINSALNYGYAVVRSAISRQLLYSGFLLSWGLHHKSQFNAMNLADDMIEPYRAMVDIIASRVANANIELNKNQRCDLAHVLHNACVIDNKKTNILISIDLMINSIRNYISNDNAKISQVLLPTILPEETMEIITE